MKNIIKTLNKVSTNNVYSPISLYYALALLSQVTNGDTKKEILDVLNLKDDEVISKMNDLHKALNINEENSKILLNSSLWFNNCFNFFEDKANEIAKNTNSAIRIGEMGTKEFDNQIHDWINTNTNNLLKDSVKNIKTSPDGLLSLISTIYLKGGWEEKFDKNKTKNDQFHISENNIVECEFMSSYIKDVLLYGKHFTAIMITLIGVGAMIFVKPNNGYTLNEIINDKDLIELLNGNIQKLEQKYFLINFSVPKFDIMADGNIINQIQKLGINKVFDMKQSNFSPITDEKDVYISEAKQATRLKIDEEGIEGASYTRFGAIMGCACFDIPIEEIDFKLDTPFMFSVVNDAAPIFVGTIIDPTK